MLYVGEYRRALRRFDTYTTNDRICRVRKRFPFVERRYTGDQIEIVLVVKRVSMGVSIADIKSEHPVQLIIAFDQVAEAAIRRRRAREGPGGRRRIRNPCSCGRLDGFEKVFQPANTELVKG